MKLTKSSIAIILSKLDTFTTQKVRVEQYPTPSELAAEIVWFAYSQGDIENKEILDAGCGTGILGLGTMFFAPKKVTFLDADKDCTPILKKNIQKVSDQYDLCKKTTILNIDISKYDKSVDTVIMNPPFGTKTKHADIDFLKKAFSLESTVYSLHKTQTKNYLIDFAKKHSYSPSHSFDFLFPIKASMGHHKKQVKKIEVTLFRFIKNN